MAGSTMWLGREVDALATQWLAQLTSWQPFSGDRDQQICITCVRYAEELQLDETPHSMLHPIAAAIDDRVTGCFTTIAFQRYGQLAESGWSFGIENGIVKVVPPGISIFFDEDEVAAEAGDLRFDLTVLYSELLGIAVAAVLHRHSTIARAVRTAVEPRVQELADQLIREVCGPH
jgi:hypothetical protein